MAVELELSAAYKPSPASFQGRLDPFTRITLRCQSLKEISRQGQAGLRGLTEETSEQTAQDLIEGLGFLRNVEIDLEGFERGGIDFRPGLESCDHKKVMERVFELRDLRRDRLLLDHIRESLTISQSVTKAISEDGNFSDLEKKAYTVKFIREKSQGYMDLADEAYQESLRKYQPEQGHSDI